jgi:hypothetical protein
MYPPEKRESVKRPARLNGLKHGTFSQEGKAERVAIHGLLFELNKVNASLQKKLRAAKR